MSSERSDIPVSRRLFLVQVFSVGTSTPIAARALAQAPADEIHVRDFGARGDGVTNDTLAIHAAARRVQEQGGGTLVFDAKTYRIGLQRARGPGQRWSYEPHPLVEIKGCRRKVTIRGNGAKLVCAPGLRYGTFDHRSGTATHNPMPFTHVRELATPYRAAIWLEGNLGGVEVSGFELDGHIGEAVIGGPWGDIGWQINHCGIWLYGNRGPHLVADIHSHHHGQDGLMLFTEIPSENTAAVPTRIERVRSEYNGRQGLSIIGGRGILIQDCQFRYTGKGLISSNPGAGLDIEAELSLIRDVTVVRCEFEDNAGPGFVADTGNSARINFRDCKFVGSRNYALWPNKPAIRFERCEIVGAVVRCYEDPTGGPAATQFLDCSFTDDPGRTRTGAVFGWRVDLGGSGGGTLFNRCSFRYTRTMQLPYSPPTVRYRDCRMLQTTHEIAYPRGIYSGRNTIDGNVSVAGYSKVVGELIVNGNRVT